MGDVTLNRCDIYVLGDLATACNSVWRANGVVNLKSGSTRARNRRIRPICGRDNGQSLYYILFAEMTALATAKGLARAYIGSTDWLQLI